eukprot:94810_1
MFSKSLIMGNKLNEEHKNNKSAIIVDYALKLYYQSQKVFNYIDTESKGKFLKFCMENALNDTTIQEELDEHNDIHECLLLAFDPNFPLPSYMHQYSDDYKAKITRYILQYCLKNNTSPSTRDWTHLVECGGSIDCESLSKLEHNMKLHHESKSIQSIDIIETLNCYLHMLQQHNDDKSFESIHIRLVQNVNQTNAKYFDEIIETETLYERT